MASSLGFPGLRDRPSSSPHPVSGLFQTAPGPGVRDQPPGPGVGMWPQGGRCSQDLSRRSRRPLSARSPRVHPRCRCPRQLSGRSAGVLTAGLIHTHPHPLIYFFLGRPEAWLPSSVAYVRVCGPCERQHPRGNVSQARPVFTSCSSLSFTRSCPVRGRFPRLGGRAPSPSLPAGTNEDFAVFADSKLARARTGGWVWPCHGPTIAAAPRRPWAENFRVRPSPKHGRLPSASGPCPPSFSRRSRTRTQTVCSSLPLAALTAAEHACEVLPCC